MHTHQLGVRLTLSRIQYPLLAILLASFVVLSWRGREPVGLRGVDELTYRVLSEALERGSYREVSQVSAPRHTRYPPAYPAWLLAVRRVAGPNLDLVRAGNIAFVAATLTLMFVVARRLAGLGVALVLSALLSLNVVLQAVGGSMLSDAMYLFLSTAALAAALHSDTKTDKSAYPAITLALAAFLTRSVGIALILALLAWLWSRKRHAELVRGGALCAVVAGGWFGYAAWATRHQDVSWYTISFTSYSRVFSQATAPPEGGAAAMMLRRVMRNAVGYGTEDLPSAFSAPTLPGTLVDNVAWVLLGMVLLAVGFVVLWRRWRPAMAYLALYVGILLVWPWRVSRLLDPILPLGLLVLLLGAQQLGTRVGRGPCWMVATTLAALLLYGSVRDSRDRGARAQQCDRDRPYTSEGCYENDIRGLAGAALYVRDVAAADDVVLAMKTSSVYFLSERLTQPATALQQVPPDSTVVALRRSGIRYVLLTGLSTYERGPLAAALVRTCAELRVERRFGPHVLLLTPAAAGAGGITACDDLGVFVRDHPVEPEPV
jgi:hypothetical protein